ncbi:MAG: leucine-rich repeat protein [Clostridia bacterium]|nr:leucine-rich repeat protein [Clostridia bacterium]
MPHTLIKAKNVISYRIPEGTVSVDSHAFDGCDEIGEVYIPKSLATLDASIFEGLKKLEMIFVHRQHPSLLSIDGVLYTRDGILLMYPRGRDEDTFRVPEKTTAIRPGAFCDMDHLKELYIPVSLVSQQSDLLPGVEQKPAIIFYERTVQGDLQLPFYEYTKLRSAFYNEPHRMIRSYIRGALLVRCADAVSVTIPPKVRYIDDAAWKQCKHVREITLPKGFPLRDIASSLMTLPRLEKVHVHKDDPEFEEDNGVVYTHTGELAFYPPCAGEVFHVREGTKSLDMDILSTCSHLREVVLPSTLTEVKPQYMMRVSKDFHILVRSDHPLFHIKDGFLMRDKQLIMPCAPLPETVRIPDGTVSIGENAFRLHTEIKSVILPDTLRIIESSAFSMCVQVEEIHLPEGLVEVGTSAFSSCGRVKSLRIPKSYDICVNSCSLDAWLPCMLEELKMPGRSIREVIECMAASTPFTHSLSQRVERRMRQLLMAGELALIREDEPEKTAEVPAEDIPTILSYLLDAGDTDQTSMVLAYSERHYPSIAG